MALELSGGAVGKRGGGWVVVAPLVCALHCMVAPGLALFAPALTLGPGIEAWGMAVTGLVSAVVVRSNARVHGRPGPWVPVAGGLLLWVGAHLGALGPLPEVAGAAVGGLAMSFGLVWSTRLRERATGPCACPSCD